MARNYYALVVWKENYIAEFLKNGTGDAPAVFTNHKDAQEARDFLYEGISDAVQSINVITDSASLHGKKKIPRVPFLALLVIGLFTALISSPVQAQPPSAATGLASLGGAVITTSTSSPEFALGYTLTQYHHLDLVGLLAPRSFGLGLGLRLPDYTPPDPTSRRVRFTLGPAFILRYSCPTVPDGCREGLRGGRLALFARVSFPYVPRKESVK